MTLARYAEYRDSGIDWAGTVPSHWTSMVLRRVVRLRTEKATERRWPIGLENIEGGTGRFLETDTEFEGDGVAFVAADVLYGKLRPYLAKVLVATQQGEAIGDFHVLSPDERLDSRFLAYLLLCPSVVALLNGSTHGAKMPRVGWDFMGGLAFALPSREEQTAIATFLDRETANIDALVEAQRRLIDLLKEKRRAVISHAVTKGLDPAVPMKNSGVEWLGEVPAHWSVAPLKRVTPGVTVGIVVEPSKYYAEEGVPALRSLNVRPGRIRMDDMVFITEEANRLLSKSQLRQGDLVAVRTGQPGTTAIVPPELDGCNCIDLIVIRKPHGSERYLCWYLASDAAVRQFSEGSGGAIQQHFNIGTALNLLVLVPPVEEQARIAWFLEEETTKLDLLVSQAQAAISLLQERRAALISAGVTGKIDVRQPAEAPITADQTTARRLVGAAVLELVANNPASGRMTSAKRMYLAEVHAGISELRGQPERKAAGPFDSALMRDVEAELARVGHIATSQPGGSGSQVVYRLAGTRGALRAELDAMLGDRRDVFDKMLADLGTLESKGVEAIATLYAVWNDMLIDGQTPTDDAVINGVLNDWHAEKRDKFTRADLVNYLGWMRRHDLTPSGRGPRTKSGALL